MKSGEEKKTMDREGSDGIYDDDDHLSFDSQDYE